MKLRFIFYSNHNSGIVERPHCFVSAVVALWHIRFSCSLTRYIIHKDIVIMFHTRSVFFFTFLRKSASYDYIYTHITHHTCILHSHHLLLFWFSERYANTCARAENELRLVLVYFIIVIILFSVCHFYMHIKSSGIAALLKISWDLHCYGNDLPIFLLLSQRFQIFLVSAPSRPKLSIRHVHKTPSTSIKGYYTK